MQIYANRTSSEAVVNLYAASTHPAVARVDDDVTDDVTGAVAEQLQDHTHCNHEIAA